MTLAKPLLVAAAVALSATPALAFHCPSDMKKIDAAMPAAQLSQEQLSKVETLRREGEELHKAGKHQEAVDKLGQAMKILGIPA